MTTKMQTAVVVAMVMLGGMAAAQEGQPPAVAFEAPVQAGAPALDSATTSLPAEVTAPSVTAEAPAVIGAEPTTQPATAVTAAAADPAVATAPAVPAAGTGEATGLGAATTAADPGVQPAQLGGPTAPLASDGPAPGAYHGRSAHAGETPAATGIPAHSMRLDSLFWQAHWVVQAVMAGLGIAAFAALVIFIQKTAEYALAFGAMRRTAKALAKSSGLHEAAAAVAGRHDPSSEMIRAADEELRLAEAEPALIPGVRERSQAALGRIEAGVSQKLRAATGILASIGSLAPFVGLFGTVFGIMNSFIAIAETKTTNLAVVAPGIAEALLATAVGLAAAIPAVLIYNICSRRLAKYRHRINDIAAATLRLQSRALDRLAAEG